VGQVQQLLQTGVPHLPAVSEPVRQTMRALGQAHGTSLASAQLGADDIRLAALLGDVVGCRLLAAVSVAAVFFGAATYLGNAPNFLVKAIADHQRVPTPTFLGFIIRYTLPCLAPMLVVVWWFFFRG
ncbi:MAG: sodium:proton antiporter, partial [Verrucomicrobia bacterium]|nr:sodium:proton antiporter [Verrucomicrobiota bacterium]